MGINKVILIGNVGKDPEVRHLEGGASVATLTLATSERYRDRTTGEPKEVTEWHNVVAWRQLADLADKYIRKGTQIYVEGRLRSRSWDDQNGQKHYTTEVLADTIQLLGRRADNPGAGAPYDASTPRSQSYSQPYQPVQPYQPAPVQPTMPRPISTPAISPEEIDGDGSDDLPF